jgi:hypothetical protein
MKSVSRIGHEPEPAVLNPVDWAGLMAPHNSLGKPALSFVWRQRRGFTAGPL